jgi:hypothetical protein
VVLTLAYTVVQLARTNCRRMPARLHVAVAGRQKIGAAADEVDAGGAGIGNSPVQQGRLQAAAAIGRDGRRIRAIADLVLHVENAGGRGLAFDAAEIERPARLTEPAARVGFEARSIGHAPAGGMRFEKLVEHGACHALDGEQLVVGHRSVGLANQRAVEVRLEATEPGQFAAQLDRRHAGHHFEARLHAVLAIPGQQRFDMRLVPRTKTEHAVEIRHRQLPRHQRRDATFKLLIGDADRIAGQPLQNLQARQGAGRLHVERAPYQVERGSEHVVPLAGCRNPHLLLDRIIDQLAIAVQLP